MENRWIDEYGFLQEIGWDGKLAISDALWRTAIRNIYAEDKTDTTPCYENGTVFRHPVLKELKTPKGNTCSRDQVIMDQVSRVITHDSLPKVNLKISDKFWQTPDMWLWMRGIRGSSIARTLFHLYNIISLPIMLKRNERLWKKGKEAYFKKGARGRYPFYAFHLMSWMTYVLPDCWLKRHVNLICMGYLVVVDPTNDLLWALHGGTYFLIEDYQPLTDFRWQRIADRLPPGIKLEEYNGPHAFDKDILDWIKSADRGQ